MSLKAEHITFSYPRANKPAVRDISFEARDGEVTVIIGANGTGKTTLIKTMLGSFTGSGSTWISGKPVSDYTHQELFRTVGYMTQEGALMSALSVMNVVLLGRLGTLNLRVQDEDIEKTVSILKLLHLDEYLNRPFNTLSGGQRRMVDVAQTLVRSPKVLIMDEPTANLDLVNELQVLELVKAYTHQRNTATVLTLHDLNMAARYADQVVLLKDGTVYKTGTPEAVITEENIRDAYGVYVHVTLDEHRIPMLHAVASVNEINYQFQE